jgi:hypothetical protein
VKLAAKENQELAVSDALLAALTGMGYPVKLARRALRVCAGSASSASSASPSKPSTPPSSASTSSSSSSSGAAKAPSLTAAESTLLSAATAYLLAKQTERDARIAREAAECETERQHKRYGKTALGKPINLPLLQSLLQMGFDEWVVAQALRQTDNDETRTLALLTDPTQLQLLQQTVAMDRAEREKATVAKAAHAAAAEYQEEVSPHRVTLSCV